MHKVSEPSGKTLPGSSRGINGPMLRPLLLVLCSWYHYVHFAGSPRARTLGSPVLTFLADNNTNKNVL